MLVKRHGCASFDLADRGFRDDRETPPTAVRLCLNWCKANGATAHGLAPNGGAYTDSRAEIRRDPLAFPTILVQIRSAYRRARQGSGYGRPASLQIGRAHV